MHLRGTRLPHLDPTDATRPVTCCPLCKRDWQPTAELVFNETEVFWCGRRLPLSGHQVTIFRLLHNNPGKLIRSKTIYDAIYPLAASNPPMPDIIKVWISRIRTVLDMYNVPFAIPKYSAYGYMVVARDGR